MKIMTALNKTSMVLKKHSPLVLSIGGVVGLGTTAFLSYKAAKKVEVIVEGIEENRQQAELFDYAREDATATYDLFLRMSKHDPDYQDQADKLDIAKSKVHELESSFVPMTRATMFKDLAGAVALPVITGVTSITCIALSYYIQNNRIISLAGALAVSTAEQQYYRNKYKKEHGEEAAQKFYTPMHEETVTRTVNGKEKKVVEVNRDAIDSLHGVWFDKSSEYVSDDHDYNLAFIRSKEEKLNFKLFKRGTITMNEVCDELGIPRTRRGAMLGWSTEKGFNLLPQTNLIKDRETGEDRPEIYVTWSTPKEIYDLVEYDLTEGASY